MLFLTNYRNLSHSIFVSKTHLWFWHKWIQRELWSFFCGGGIWISVSVLLKSIKISLWLFWKDRKSIISPHGYIETAWTNQKRLWVFFNTLYLQKKTSICLHVYVLQSFSKQVILFWLLSWVEGGIQMSSLLEAKRGILKVTYSESHSF